LTRANGMASRFGGSPMVRVTGDAALVEDEK
jgi:hypothetical protein